MSDYLRIARAYLSITSAAVWCFMLFCLLTYSVVGEELSRSQTVVMSGVLSKKSYLAMFAYFNACLLGVLLRDNIAHPWASLLPHYRQRHLLVTTLIALIFLGIPMFSMQFLGTSDIAPTSVTVVFLACLAAGLWTLHHPLLGFLAFPFLIFVMVPSSSFPQFARFIAGTNPAISAASGLISLVALWAFARRLMVLNEEMLEYQFSRLWGDMFRGRGQTLQGQSQAFDNYLATLPADRIAAFQKFDWQKKPFTNLKQVDELSGYRERGLWQRLQLWRLGTAPIRTSVSTGWLLLITLFVILPVALIPPSVGVEHPARNFVVLFSVQVMTNPFNVLLWWFLSRHRLGNESLRPRTRQEFVRELGLALMWDMFQCWLAGVLCLVIAAAIWAPELLQVNNLLLFIVGTGVGQLCFYALMATCLLKRGIVTSIFCTLVAFMATAMWMISTMHSGVGVEVNMVIASVLAVVSMATIALAYRRWCRADLD